jgi:sugar O-acyltransferase (sialic acid O-acetyltransferase NeuD family)
LTKKIVLLGGGGHCVSVLDTLLSLNQYNEIAISSKTDDIGTSVLNTPILYCDDELENLFLDGYKEGFITLGRDVCVRKRLFNKLSCLGYRFPSIIDFSATISNFVKLNKGVFVGKNVVVNANVTIGSNAIINTSAVVEHDCIIGDFVHIAPGAVICGGASIGKGTLIGANSVVKPGIKIGKNSIIGVGSVIIEDIDDNMMVYGNSCRVFKKLGDCSNGISRWSMGSSNF